MFSLHRLDVARCLLLDCKENISSMVFQGRASHACRLVHDLRTIKSSICHLCSSDEDNTRFKVACYMELHVAFKITDECISIY